MISYLYSKKVLKKAIIKIKDENIKSVKSRVSELTKKFPVYGN